MWIEESQNAEFRMKTKFVIVDEVTHDLNAGTVNRRLDCSTKYVEVPIRNARFEMHARLDNCLAPALRR